MQREGRAQEKKALNICLFSQITENLVVLYSDLVKLTRCTTASCLPFSEVRQKVPVWWTHSYRLCFIELTAHTVVTQSMNALCRHMTVYLICLETLRAPLQCQVKDLVWQWCNSVCGRGSSRIHSGYSCTVEPDLCYILYKQNIWWLKTGRISPLSQHLRTIWQSTVT